MPALISTIGRSKIDDRLPHLGVVDRASRHDDGLDVVAGDERLVGAGVDPELRTELFGAPGPGRGHGDEACAGQLERISRVYGAHAAEACDAETDRIP